MPSRSFGRAVLFLLIGLAGCTSTGPSDLRLLDAARTRWAESGLDLHYQAELTRSCFCGFPDAFPRTRIEVVDGELVGAWDVASGNAVPRGFLNRFPSVTELFDLIQFEIAAKSAEVRVEYHPEHGAPMQIYIDRIRNAIDDEVAITIHLLDDGVLDATPARLR